MLTYFLWGLAIIGGIGFIASAIHNYKQLYVSVKDVTIMYVFFFIVMIPIVYYFVAM